MLIPTPHLPFVRFSWGVPRGLLYQHGEDDIDGVSGSRRHRPDVSQRVP